MLNPESRKGTILVIGGGIAGITAAVEAAEIGYAVHLVEREPFLGGQVLKLSRYFPKLCPPACGLEINFRRLQTNPRINVHTMAEVRGISGRERAYTVSVQIRPRFVNEKCTACGECARVCRTEIPDPLNFGFNRIKAAYLPNGMGFPQRFVLAPEIIATPDAENCRSACPYGAIDLHMGYQTLDLEVGAVIVATGWDPYDASRIENLGFGRAENVITGIQMERFAAEDGPTKGRILRPADGKEIRHVAFCQCAGQRDENHLPYCSRVCCLASLKQALLVREQYPRARISIYYIDLRAFGRNESLLARVREDASIRLIRGKVAKVKEDPSNRDLLLQAESTASGKIAEDRVDLLVLATGMVPSNLSLSISGGFLKSDPNGFILDSPGIYPAGCAKRPLDVAATVQDATGAVLKAMQSTQF